MPINTPLPDPVNIDQAIRWGAHCLVDSESPHNESRTLLCHVLECDSSFLFTWPDKALSAQQVDAFSGLIERRVQGNPIAYLLGYRHFWTLTLAVNNSTLIPRPETEHLIETALNVAVPENAKVCDLGTGTGAIALALASERPSWSVTGVDSVAAAVELAQKNASLNGGLKVNWRVSHWFDEIPKEEQFDLIVSNPPYVESNSPYLQEGDVRFEPSSALTSGEDGLDDIRQIIAQAPNWLSKGGWLLLEHGFAQHRHVRMLLEQRGFSQCQVIKDLQGIQRISYAQW